MTGVLHIAADFPNQDVYPELVRHLAERGVRQTVHSVVRSAREAAWQPTTPGHARYHIPYRLRPWHRVLFRTKIRMIVRQIEADVPRDAVDLVHAHCLYSDGAAALRLHRAWGTPFLAAFRNVDLNAFMRFRPDLRGVRDAVLRAAARVVFLSPGYEERLLARLSRPMRAVVEAKARVIPNGVAPRWLAWTPEAAVLDAPPGDVLRLLYVGDFTRNKNLRNLVAAVDGLADTRRVHLTLVGGGGDGDAEIRRLAASGAHPWLSLAGRVAQGPALRDIYRAHDIFVMPSRTESFGVAYVEALSQGLPVVHTAGQGVAGHFAPGTVSEAADGTSPAAIAGAIQRLAARFAQVRHACVAQARRFDWTRIAREYETEYRAMLAGHTEGEDG